MNTSLEIDTAEVERLFQQLGSQFSKNIGKALSASAQYGIAIIQDRTEDGIGYKGIFAPYSPSYARAKAKGWKRSSPKAKTYRKAFGGDASGKVNLMVHGTMLSSMRSKLNGAALSAEIYFSRASEAKKAAQNNAKRPFFGFNEREKNKVRKFFYSLLKV